MLITAREGAQLVGVPVSTVATWHERGLLAPVGRRSTRGRPYLYDSDAVLSAERASRLTDPTRRRARELARQTLREV